ncbi:YtxH domain-containing protein [Geomonas sp.]|uniref:YtxH domain-containing protein n=1 Tax=Geomonas sp. TaxID=2651584 RepID=UPI002B473E34|nr:YtxH domain-containing protein [Geomonas sp.]HJV35146.1 YtxH domain-containing protein [Geomonas sp.]
MSKKSEQALLAFLAGAAVAAGAALLFTPRTGREIREKLGEARDEALDKIKQRMKGGATGKGDPLNYDGGDCWI